MRDNRGTIYTDTQNVSVINHNMASNPKYRKFSPSSSSQHMPTPSTSGIAQHQQVQHAATTPNRASISPTQQSLNLSPEVLSRDDVNYYRRQRAISIKGRNVLFEVFQWTFQGNVSEIKVFIINDRKKKRLFNNDQLKLLDSGEYDISMLFLFLKHFCGLADPLNAIWTALGGQSLESRIYELKCYRNVIAHGIGNQQMTDQELERELLKIENLLTDILKLAAKHTGQDPKKVSKLVTEIKQYFQQLQEKVREPLDLSDTSQISNLREELAKLSDAFLSEIQIDCGKELCQSYPDEFELELVHWIIKDLKVRPSLMFTKMIIQEDVSMSRPSLNLQPRDMNYEELLVLKRRDGVLPDVLIVSGEGGVGKSTLLKYLVENWVKEMSRNQGQHVTEIQNLCNYSVLLYF